MSEAVNGLEEKNMKRYVSVLGSTGDIREVVPEGTEGAVRREYETSDGKTGVKWEKVYKSLGGKIVDVNLFDGDYGTQLQIAVEYAEGVDPIVLALATNSSFGEDVMKKLTNINFNEHVVFTPYAFINDKGKNQKGMTITQGDTKIQNYFWDTEAKKSTNGLPEPKGDTAKFTKEKWVLYFATVRDFLVDFTRDTVLPKFGHTGVEEARQTEAVDPSDF